MPAAGDAPPPAKAVVEDIYGFLRVLDDGTVLRSSEGPEFCPATFPGTHPSVQWKEAVYDKAKNLRVRMSVFSLPIGNRRLPAIFTDTAIRRQPIPAVNFEKFRPNLKFLKIFEIKKEKIW